MKYNLLSLLTVAFIFFYLIRCSNGIDSSNPIDMQWIAYVNSNNGNYNPFQVEIFDKNGENKRILFKDYFYCFNVEWMKNRPELIYNGFNREPNNSYLKIFNLKNFKTQTLWENETDSIKFVSEICTSASDKIVFVISHEDSLNYFCTIEKDGSNFKKIALISGSHLAYINNRIYFIDRGELSNSADDKVAAINDDGSGYEQITNDNIGGIFDYDISPDGNELIYMYWQGSGDNILYHSDIHGNSPQPIFYLDSAASSKPDYDYIKDPTFSPDGTKILFSQKTAVLTILDLKTLNFEQFDLNILGNLYDAAWIDSGKKIVFATNENGLFNLCLINSDGSEYKKVISLEEYDFTFKASPEYN